MCNNDIENMNCIIECVDGYDFDYEIKLYFMCGKNMFYFWDFQIDDNLDGKMFVCLGIKLFVIIFKIVNKYNLKKNNLYFFLLIIYFFLIDNCQLLYFRN